MASDSGDDAAALRDRVDQLEQTVAEQQTTIESLSSPTASRRGVLAALTGVAGAGAVGAYSQRGAAQAAGQVGTQSEPVDVEAWSLNVQDQLAGDLDAGGNKLTNVGAAEVGGLLIKGLSNNATTSLLSGLNDSDEGANVVTQRTDDVSTSAKTILELTNDDYGGLVVVYGVIPGTTTEFVDLILKTRSSTVIIVDSVTVSSPANRSYGAPGGDIELSMGSDTYQVVSAAMFVEL